MRSTFIIVITVSVFCLMSFGCGGAAPANGPNVNTANTVNANADNPLQPKAKTPEQTTNNAPTLSPVFKAYCEAKIKSDETALRKIYSADTLKSFDEQMKAEKIKTLAKFLEDEKVTAKVCEVRNETITGDSAVAEIKTDSYPNGLKVVFVKENGEWKMTTKAPDFEAVKSAAKNTNAAK